MTSLPLINEIVRECILQHEGGEAFFDELDAKIRNNDHILEDIYALAKNFFSSTDLNRKLIVSGKFGKSFFEKFSSDNMPILVAPGGQRIKVDLDGIATSDISGYNFVFIDDSLYSGKTRDVLRGFIESHGGNFLGSAVVYDGSKCSDVSVKSLYQYYKKN